MAGAPHAVRGTRAGTGHAARSCRRFDATTSLLWWLGCETAALPCSPCRSCSSRLPREPCSNSLPPLPHLSLQGCDGAGRIHQVPHTGWCRLALPDGPPPAGPVCARRHGGVSAAAQRRQRQQRTGCGKQVRAGWPTDPFQFTVTSASAQPLHLITHVCTRALPAMLVCRHCRRLAGAVPDLPSSHAWSAGLLLV